MMEYRTHLNLDKDIQCNEGFVEVKDVIFNKYICCRDLKKFCKEFLLEYKRCGFYNYKRFTEIVGCPPKVLRSKFYKVQEECYGLEYYRQKFWFIDPNRLARLNLKQCTEDGIENILPFVVHFEETPRQLKKRFGKSFWKKITKNSFYRNKLLIRFVEFGIANEFPTSFLEAGYIFQYFRPVHITGKTYKEKIEQLHWFSGLYRDTERLRPRLENREYDIQTLHDKLSKKRARNRASDEAWFPPLEFSVNGYKFQLVNSHQMLHKEALIFQNCIAGYYPAILDGYRIFVIYKDEIPYGVLGVNHDNTIDQFSGVKNARIDWSLLDE